MSDVIKPLYLATIRVRRFICYLVMGCFLLLGYFLPFGLYLVCLQLALICILMAVYQWWEWSRLTVYEEMLISDDGVLYRHKGENFQLLFSDIAVTFLYYSSIDKEKGSATLCLKLINGKIYRFCGIQQVDHLLPKIKLDAKQTK